MQRISSKYKQLPPTESFQQLKWFVIFIGTVRNIPGVHHVCVELNLPDFVIWAPVYQEHCKTQTDIALTDRLIYPGYIFIGVPSTEDAATLSAELRNEAKGFLLGSSTMCLTEEELQCAYENAVRLAEAPKIMFDVKEGDSVIMSSGFLSGFRATVEKVLPEGRVKLKVFFMNREVSVDMSVLDIQSLGNSVDDLD